MQKILPHWGGAKFSWGGAHFPRRNWVHGGARFPGVQNILWQFDKNLSIFCFVEVQKVHSRSACRILPHEDIIYDAYMQELNVVVLYAVIFVLRSVLLPSVLLIPVLVRETDAWWEGQGMTMFFVMVIFYNQFWFSSTYMVQLQQNDFTSKRISALLYTYPSHGCFSIKSTYSLALAPRDWNIYTSHRHTNLAEARA